MKDLPHITAHVVMSDPELDAYILGIVLNAFGRMTPLELKKRVKKAQSLKRGQFESSIKRLVQQKELVYAYQLGNSFLERSFEKPVRVTDSIVLKPPACDYRALTHDVVINIKAGAAFGTGCHPTTRLCLKALEWVCRHDCRSQNGNLRTRVLDIGTGSGVLVIAAVKLGGYKGIGLDIDPCARVEATENVVLNNLASKIEVSSQSIDSVKGLFGLVVANLRFPTLKSYFTLMARLLERGGVLVISGIKIDEIKPIKILAKQNRLAVFWEGVEHEWAALALSRLPRLL